MDQVDWQTLEAENAALSKMWSKVFLLVESRRLNREFFEPSAYVAGSGRHSPEVPMWKAPLFAVRDFFRYRRWLSPVWDYPRNALFRSLFCLISDERTRRSLPSPGKFLTPAPAGCPTEITAWEEVYQFWWERYG